MRHTDGPRVVLNIAPSDRSGYDGGNLLFYESTAETFDRHDRERRYSAHDRQLAGAAAQPSGATPNGSTGASGSNRFARRIWKTRAGPR